MDIRAYIQSGVIESYVLGLATHEEMAELEVFSLQHSAIKIAVDEFSASLEHHAFENKIAPPPAIKQKVLAAIKAIEIKETPVISFSEKNNTDKKLSILRMAVAASFIFFIASAALNFYFYNQYRSKSDAYQAMLSEKETLIASNQVYRTSINQWKSAAQMMADTAMAMIKLKAMPGKKNSMAMLFWDTRNKSVYVMPNKLPTPAAGKQYQLWAMVNGKPVDAGMVSMDCEGACKMKSIPVAQAFAISLEKAGGSAQPTMTEIYVMAKTNS